MKKNNPAVRKPNSLRMKPVAFGLSSAVLMPMSVLAQSAVPAEEMPAMVVKDSRIDPNPNAEVGVPYKAKTSADARRTRPLAEIPSTIAVVTKAAIDDAGVTDLKQILSAQPGITLGVGENGNMFGDRYIIRGYEARSDVFVDGLRDPGMSTRESFAIEQLEISKGPSSSFAGRGTSGGGINAITKQATLDHDFARTSFGLGTDQYQRFTVDANKALSDTFALRVNGLSSSQGVPDRDPSKRERSGLALSGMWEINSDLDVTLDYYGLRAKDKQPDLGQYLVNRKPVTNVPVYAQQNDFLTSDTDTITARVNFKLAPDKKITSLTRYGTTSNAYATTGASFNATANSAVIDNGHTGWQEVDYFAHQTNLRWDKELAGMKHEFIFGLEFSDHKVTQGNYTVVNGNAFNCRTAAGAGPNNAFCISDTAGNFISDPTSVAGRSYARNGKNQDWRAKSLAFSVMDTVDITDKFTLFGGARVDQVDFSLERFRNESSTPTTVTGSYGYKETLKNGHLGVSYKVTPNGMVYASVATAQNINGGESDSGTSAGYGGLILYNGQAAGSEPIQTINKEVGTKWNLFDNRLLATAALFQTIKSKVTEGADYNTFGSFNTGKNRVEGVELSLVGNVTDKITLQAGAAFMKSKVLESATTSLVGHRLANFADTTYNLLAKYQATDKFHFGAQARYQSQRCGGQPDTGVTYATGTTECSQPVPEYLVYDFFAGYRINKKVDVRLNVLNVENKDYYTAVYRGNGTFLYKGDARQAYLTLNVDW